MSTTLTTAEAAVVLGISQSRVRTLAGDGRLAGTLGEGGWELDAASVAAYKATNPGQKKRGRGVKSLMSSGNN